MLSIALTQAVSARADSIEGHWLTEQRTGIVELYRCGSETLCGRLLWLRIKPEDNNPGALDLRNPTADLRGRPLCGLVIMGAFRRANQNEWKGGWLYDPESGNTYNGAITLQPDDTLNLRGYIGISLFGKSQVWTRSTASTSRCLD